MSIYLVEYSEEYRTMTFRIDGVEKEITVGVYPNGDGISIDYGEDGVGITFKSAEMMKKILGDGEE